VDLKGLLRGREGQGKEDREGIKGGGAEGSFPYQFLDSPLMRSVGGVLKLLICF